MRFFLLPMTTIALAAPAAEASWTPGAYLAKSLDGLIELVDRTQRQLPGMGLAAGGPAVLGAHLTERARAKMTFDLKANTPYVFLAASSEQEDIDLALFDPAGKLVAEDEDDDPTPVLIVNVKTSGRYTLEVRNADDDADTFAAVAFLHEGGHALRAAFLKASFARFLATASLAGMAKGLIFNDQGDWALMASMLEEGEVETYSGVDTHGRSGVALALGDADVKDLDLVHKDRNGKVVGSDKEPDANPVLEIGVTTNAQLSLIGASVERPGLAALFVLVDPKRPRTKAAPKGKTDERGKKMDGPPQGIVLPDAVLEVFFAPWCGACTQLRRQLAEAGAPDRLEVPGVGPLRISWVDVSDDESRAAKMKGQAIPELQLSKGGRTLATITGAKSARELGEWAARALRPGTRI